MDHEKMLDTLTTHLEKMIRTDHIMGEAIQVGEFTCIPILKFGMGFGSGGGEGTDGKGGNAGSGGGAGAGLGVEPMAFLVTRGDEISILNVGKAKGIQAVFEKVPDLIDRLMEMKEKRDAKKTTETKA